MRKNIIISLLLVFTLSKMEAQIIRVSQNELLKHVLRDTISIPHFIHVGPSKNTPLLPLKGIFKNYYQDWIKSKTGFYIIIQGSGQVFKAQKWDESVVEFQRIDSTEYFGYNFGSINFFIKDSLLSYGGYGFWHRNGVLRYLDDRNQWDRIKLNKEYPVLTDEYSFNNDQSKLFFYLNLTGSDVVTDDPIIDSFFVLDVRTKNVNTLGKAKIDMKPFIDNFSILTPYGRFYTNPLNTGANILLDIQNNTIYETITKGSNDYTQYLLKVSNDADKGVIFYQNGYIYASPSPFDKIDSIKFDITTFKKINQKIYSDLNTFQNDISKSIVITLILLLFTSLGYFLYTKNKLVQKKAKRKLEFKESDNLFTDLEIGFLRELINRSGKKGYCTTDEINSLLGVAQKTIEIQKKARTDFITRINQKYKDNFKKIDMLIVRERSEKDKRSFYYSIDAEKQKLIDRYIND